MSNNQQWVSAIIPIAVAGITLGLGALTTWIWKIDDRQFDMTSDFVSKSELKDEMASLKENVDEKFQGLTNLLNDRKDDRRQFEHQILLSIKDTNDSVQALALKLEKRTK